MFRPDNVDPYFDRRYGFDESTEPLLVQCMTANGQPLQNLRGPYHHIFKRHEVHHTGQIISS